MYKKYSLIFVIAMILFLSSCGTIPKIQFAQPGIELSRDYETIKNNISEEKMQIFEKKYPVYKIERPKLDQKHVEKICNLFDISSQTKKTTELYDGYSGKDKTISFNSNTSFHYSYTPRGYENIPITIDDETLKNKAVEFLQTNGLFPEDFVYFGMGQGKMQLGDNSPIIYEKIVGFNRIIDGYPVIGNSHINIGFYQNAISSLSIQYNEYKAFKKVNTVSYEAAIAQLKQQNIIFEYDVEKITAKPDIIELTDAEIVYVDHAYDKKSKYIQPAYRLTGIVSDVDGNKSDFAAVVHAVAE